MIVRGDARLLAVLCGVAMLSWASAASAFCGFYVAGADQDLYADATMVVMMREGNKTVLSMRNDYRGPVEHFAMVVPVPVVLHEGDVRTLPKELFARVDTLAAPRLVEYWEQDPCATGWGEGIGLGNLGTIGHGAGSGSGYGRGAGRRPMVRVEAEFAVGEYEIVILSADDSGALDAWLRAHEYNIPAGAAEALAPYVQAGTKFFVAKIDVSKVTFEHGRAMLSPLRVQYESDDFSLPIRLGMLNSGGTQDLIVHVLGRNQRYEAASYENTTIPTNIEVDDTVRTGFGAFYAALFDQTLASHEGAVVTEYAWQATGCDPCPGPVLSAVDLLTLGADYALGLPSAEVPEGAPGTTGPWITRVRRGPTTASEGLHSMVVRRGMRRYLSELSSCHEAQFAGRSAAEATVTATFQFDIAPDGSVTQPVVTEISHEGLAGCFGASMARWSFPEPDGGNTVRVVHRMTFLATPASPRGFAPGRPGPMQEFVLTRLHYRYGRGDLGDDLVLRPAEPIEGGRERDSRRNDDPAQAPGPTPAAANNFQGRYIIRHPWEGEVSCEDPRRGIWGGPPAGLDRGTGPVAATDLGSQARGGIRLADVLKQPLPALGIESVGDGAAPPADGPETPPEQAPASETPPATAAGGAGGCAGCSTAGTTQLAWPAPAMLLSLVVLVVCGGRRSRSRR